LNQTPYKNILIISTTDDVAIAEKMAALLVESKQAACVSISSPITSIYRWQGKIETEKEVMLFIKTREDKYQAVEKIILDNHNYEVPEIIALPIVKGEHTYLQWISDNLLPTPLE